MDELQDVVRRVTQLEGLLPICASCRNVRDDDGSSSSIEDDIGSRTPLEFTHAICPGCMKHLYPHMSAESGRVLDKTRDH